MVVFYAPPEAVVCISNAFGKSTTALAVDGSDTGRCVALMFGWCQQEESRLRGIQPKRQKKLNTLSSSCER